MAYGFNDDKSKFDLDEIANRFVVVEGNLSNVVKGYNTVTYTLAQLSEMGIDNIADYVVVGAMARYAPLGSGSYWTTELNSDVSAWDYPPMIRVDLATAGGISAGGMTVNVYSLNASGGGFSGDWPRQFRIVLMKVA